MTTYLTAATAPLALNTQNLVTYPQGLFGQLFLGIVGIVAIFFLFTREITRFVQFIVLAVAIAMVFCTPSIVQTLGTSIANALGVRRRSTSPMHLPTYTNIWRIEKRLYKLYDFRLSVPLPITWIAVFAGITVQCIFFLVVIGLPFNHNLVWLYVLPTEVLTWLTTRPVIENKRLPELVSSQLRHLSEPRTWCRMTPFAEKDDVYVSVRVWHRHSWERPEKAKKASPPAERSASAFEAAMVAGAAACKSAARQVTERRHLPTAAYQTAQSQMACAEN